MLHLSIKAKAFVSTFYFFSTQKANPEKNKNSLQDRAHVHASFARNNNGQTEARNDNSGFKKLGIQWLIEHSTSYQILSWFDSLDLRNPLPR
jgi:hypothetical protein